MKEEDKIEFSLHTRTAAYRDQFRMLNVLFMLHIAYERRLTVFIESSEGKHEKRAKLP